MKTTQAQSLMAFALFSSLSSAMPLAFPALNIGRRNPQPQSYSVVAVDGGSATTSTIPAATKTVTDAVTQTQVQTATILSTIIATPSAANQPATTQVVPQTVTYATTIVETPSPSTVTIEPSVTSVPYDNGQWKTTYYFRSTVAPSIDINAPAVTSLTSSAPSVAVAAAAPTTTVDPGQWAAWSQKDNTGAWSPQ